MSLTIPAPMLASACRRAFTDPQWIYEIKYDGYRCIARCGAVDRVQLMTRHGTDCTAWFPEIAHLLAEVPGGPHVIDGEVCVLDDIGRSDFESLQARVRRRRWQPGCRSVTFCAFDVLFLNGRSVMAVPLMERKERLRELLQPFAAQMIVVGEFAADAALFSTIVLGARLEGLVAKRRDSIYEPGVRTRNWLKIKRPGWQEGRIWTKGPTTR